jgi:hypothetical protein
VLLISTKFQKAAVCKPVVLLFHVGIYVRVSVMSTTGKMETCVVLSGVRGKESAACLKIAVCV